MASAIPIDLGIADEQRDGSGEFFTFTMGTTFKGAKSTSDGTPGRSRPRGRTHHRSAGGDGLHR